MSTSVQEGVVSAEASAVSARSLLDHDQSDLAELFADLAPDRRGDDRGVGR